MNLRRVNPNTMLLDIQREIVVHSSGDVLFITLIIDLKSQLFVDNDLSVTNRRGLLEEDIKRLLFHDLGFLRLLEVLNKLILGMVSKAGPHKV